MNGPASCSASKSVPYSSGSGCQYYEDFRVKKTTADLKEEQANLLRDYRLCLEKYQGEPSKAKEMCAPYTQRLREIEVTHH